MEKAKVYFSDFRTKAFGDGLPTKLKKLIKKAGVKQLNMEGKFVAIKLHFGELGNISYLRPNYSRAVADVVKEFGGKPFSDFKPALADLCVAHLAPISTKMNELMADKAEIDKVLKAGSERAAAIARPVLDEVKSIMGFWKG